MRSHHDNRLTNHSSHGHARRPIRRPVSFLARIVAQCLFPTVSESSNLGGVDGLAQGSVIGERSAEAQEESAEEQCQRMCLHSVLNIITRSLFLTATGPSSSDPDPRPQRLLRDGRSSHVCSGRVL